MDQSKTAEESPPRGREMGAEEYLAHVAYSYLAAPADTPEESVAKALLELAAARLGLDPQDLVNTVLQNEPGGRILPPWDAGTGVPAGLRVEEKPKG